MKRRGGNPGLGMGRRIPRRDFVQGMLAGAATRLGGALLLPPTALAAGAAAAGTRAPYPPLLTGLRGSAPGTFEVAHALRDGAKFPDGQLLDEHYDLVVVGAGISGLAAAHFYRQAAGPKARILLLDNHDDFGGHARRNEFRLGGKLALCNGGTLMIDSPRPYGPASAGLLRDLGIDPAALSRQCEHPGFYESAGLARAAFFDRETFGVDRLVTGIGTRTPEELYASAPFSEQARADIVRLVRDEQDYLPDLASAAKKDLLSRISYRDYLLKHAKVDPMVAAFYQAYTHGEWGVGIDAVSALDCWPFDPPGLKGLKLPAGSIGRMGPTPAGYADTGGSERFHFPDGNASIARLLVRRLIPRAMPGHDVRDIVTARADYGRLDEPGSATRLRLESTVVNVAHLGDAASAREVQVSYVRDGRTYRVRASRCVLACWHVAIAHLCPELPEAQRDALRQVVKTPLVYTTVALANWRAFRELGAADVYAPGGYHTAFRLNPTVDIGAYRSPRHPDEPMLIRMTRTPCQPGLPEEEQHRVGRADLLATPFGTFEERIREQLGRVLGPGGFDPARDIRAITVNRWPHGYAREYNPLFDPDGPEGQRWYVRARQPFGRIAIANSDAGGQAYTDSAIDQAWRAVGELTHGID
jgi:spermidine dehydrogenase